MSENTEDIYKIKNSLLKKFSTNNNILLILFLSNLFLFYFPFLLFFMLSLMIVALLVGILWAIVLIPSALVLGLIRSIKGKIK